MNTPRWDLDDATLRAAGNIKWTFVEPDVLPAWVAEMDVAPSTVVADAIRAAVLRGNLGYPSTDDVTGLAETTADYLMRQFGMAIEPAQVVSTGDVMAGIRLTLETLCEAAPVIVPVPSYPPFLDVVPLAGRQLVTVPFVGRELDLEGIDAALAAGARTVLLAQPHNPLGRVFSAIELSGLRDVVLRHGARVISDEIHAPLVRPGVDHVPYSSVPGTDEHTVTLVAATKAWNFPGLKCAQLITHNDRDRRALAALPHVSNHGTSTLGIAATTAVYRDGGPWLDAVRAHLEAQWILFERLVREQLPNVRFAPGQATYLAWLDATATGLADPSAVALDRGRVFVNPGHTFGTDYAQCVRVNLATSTERLERIVARLAAAWAA